jgi:hypothetical protein
MAYEYDGSHWRVTATRRLEVGQQLVVGREGDVRPGVVVPNEFVSRHAMRVSATEHGWDVTVSNRNGAMLHPWCLPPQRAVGRQVLIDWPLVAVRMLPSSGLSRHWVLLEFDHPFLLGDVTDYVPSPDNDERRVPTTANACSPRGLTNAEREALRIVFEAQMRWPPSERAEPMLLKQAAARLGITISGVQDRLKSALARALALGQDRAVALTDPSYVYVLARAGYLDLPTQLPHRQLPTQPEQNEPASH